MRYLAKKDEVLETAAKRVFGDIVVSAYSCGIYFQDRKPNRSLYSAIKMYKDESPEINNGSKDICIEFTNGRKVLFTNSEWGSMVGVDSKTLLVGD